MVQLSSYRSWKRRLVEKVLIYVLDFIMTILLFVYVLARVLLIARTLALWRRQPPFSFLAVDWTRFIPHFWLWSSGDAGQFPSWIRSIALVNVLFFLLRIATVDFVCSCISILPSLKLWLKCHSLLLVWFWTYSIRSTSWKMKDERWINKV